MKDDEYACPLHRSECPLEKRNGYEGHTPAEALMLLWTWAQDARLVLTKMAEEVTELKAHGSEPLIQMAATVETLDKFRYAFVAVCSVLVVLGVADFVSNMLGH